MTSPSFFFWSMGYIYIFFADFPPHPRRFRTVGLRKIWFFKKKFRNGNGDSLFESIIRREIYIVIYI